MLACKTFNESSLKGVHVNDSSPTKIHSSGRATSPRSATPPAPPFLRGGVVAASRLPIGKRVKRVHGSRDAFPFEGRQIRLRQARRIDANQPLSPAAEELEIARRL